MHIRILSLLPTRRACTLSINILNTYWDSIIHGDIAIKGEQLLGFLHV